MSSLQGDGNHEGKHPFSSLDTIAQSPSESELSAPTEKPTALFGVDPSRSADGVEEPPPTPPESYRLLERLGKGGMGEVWLARQETLGMQVAIKFISSKFFLPDDPIAMLDSRKREYAEYVSRFIREGKSMALLNHPYIARIHDAGFTSKQCPFIVMEAIAGKPVTQFCDDGRLSIKDRLEIFRKICEGVQHAHSKGLIHRDLKPQNILVTEIDGAFIPKIIDFGLVKALKTQPTLDGITDHTIPGTICGTPLYMSPEQASGGKLEVDNRTDVYSLGAVLYELLTGTTPLLPQHLNWNFRLGLGDYLQSFAAVPPSKRLSSPVVDLNAVSSKRRTSPSFLMNSLQGDLDWVVMKSIESEPKRRYATADALSAEIHRFIDGEPVSAVPPSNLYRLRKSIKRNQLLAFSGFAIATALLLGFITASGFAIVAYQAHQVAQERGNALEKQIARKHFQLASFLADEWRGRESFSYLEKIPENSKSLEFDLLNQRVLSGLLTYYPPIIPELIDQWSIGPDHQSLTMVARTAGFRIVNQPLDTNKTETLYEVDTKVNSPSVYGLNHPGTLLAMIDKNTTLNVIELDTQKPRYSLSLEATLKVNELSFSKTSRYLALSSGTSFQNTDIKVIDVQNGTIIFSHTLAPISQPSNEQYLPPSPGDNNWYSPPPPASDSSPELAIDPLDQPFSESPIPIISAPLESIGHMIGEIASDAAGAAVMNFPENLMETGVFEQFSYLDVAQSLTQKKLTIADSTERVLVAFPTANLTVAVWDIIQNTKIHEFPVSANATVQLYDLSPDAKQLFIASDNGTITQISLENELNFHTFYLPDSSVCSVFEFSADSSCCLIGTSAGNIFHYNCEKNKSPRHIADTTRQFREFVS